MPEVADYMYVDTNATMPVPPMMLRCMDEAMLHSEVPRDEVMIATMETPWSTRVKRARRMPMTRRQDDGGSDLPGGLPAGESPVAAFLGGGMPGRAV